MKKIIMILLLFITGCSKSNYQIFVDEINKQNNFDNEDYFDINISYDDITSYELMYQVVIDNPKENISDLKCLTINNVNTKDMFPSIGILDNPVSLVKDNIDIDNNITKGISLVGYIDKEDINETITFKTICEFKINDKLIKNYYKKDLIIR